jgi:four helix bundle protein
VPRYAARFRDLMVYEKARVVAKDICRLTSDFPKEEIHSLTSQIGRSSRSVGARIAEAWSKRRYPRHFISKLTDADGEQQETQHWLETALDCRYVDDARVAQLLPQLGEIGRMLNGLMAEADQFCGKGPIVRDSEIDYFVSKDEPLITDD